MPRFQKSTDYSQEQIFNRAFDEDGESLKTSSAPASFINIAGAATTVVKRRHGILVGIVVNKPVANSTITIYDNDAASGDKIATINNPVGPLVYNCKFKNGLTIVTSAADDLTVLYR